jgi:hypothetical protein
MSGYREHEFVRPAPGPRDHRCVECGLPSSNPVHDEDEDPTAGFLYEAFWA